MGGLPRGQSGGARCDLSDESDGLDEVFLGVGGDDGDELRDRVSVHGHAVGVATVTARQRLELCLDVQITSDLGGELVMDDHVGDDVGCFTSDTPPSWVTDRRWATGLDEHGSLLH